MRYIRASQSIGPASAAILALTSLGAATSALAQSVSTSSGIDEVVVTAQKVEQREIDVPVAVSVVSSDTLVSQDLVQLTDYYNRIPGLQVGASPGGANGIGALSLRGITTGGSGNPTLAVMIDDVPFGATTYLGQPPFPDFDAAILDHIEVLRGPQGTLYGASSLGGLIKFVTKTPDTENYWAHVEAGPSFVDGGSTGWSGRGAVNIPLISDYAALMVSGFYRDDPAWIDNVYPDGGPENQRQHGADPGWQRQIAHQAHGCTDDQPVGHRPAPGHPEFDECHGLPAVCDDSHDGDELHAALRAGHSSISVPSTGLSTFEVFSAKITYDFGWAQLTSLSAWNHTAVAVQPGRDLCVRLSAASVQHPGRDGHDRESEPELAVHPGVASRGHREAVRLAGRFLFQPRERGHRAGSQPVRYDRRAAAAEPRLIPARDRSITRSGRSSVTSPIT